MYANSSRSDSEVKLGLDTYPDSHFEIRIPKKMKLVDISTESLNIKKYTYSNKDEKYPQIYRITVIPPLEQYSETYPHISSKRF